MPSALANDSSVGVSKPGTGVLTGP
jgi:hypothetical protein